jgi:hypothetical protein
VTILIPNKETDHVFSSQAGWRAAGIPAGLLINDNSQAPSGSGANPRHASTQFWSSKRQRQALANKLLVAWRRIVFRQGGAMRSALAAIFLLFNIGLAIAQERYPQYLPEWIWNDDKRIASIMDPGFATLFRLTSRQPRP